MDKKGWRERALARRCLGDAGPNPPANLALITGLVGLLPGAGETVAGFLSFGAEPDTGPLLRGLIGHGLSLLLPAPGPKRTAIEWGLVHLASCALPVTQPGTLVEPPPPRLPAQALAQCQLVLVPALVVDRTGTRLGRGGGWYDKALRYSAAGAIILAVVYPTEVLPAGTLPSAPHDFRVHGALTGAGVELFGTLGKI